MSVAMARINVSIIPTTNEILILTANNQDVYSNGIWVKKYFAIKRQSYQLDLLHFLLVSMYLFGKKNGYI